MVLNGPVGRVLEWWTGQAVSVDVRHRGIQNQREAGVAEAAESWAAGMT